MVAEAAVAAEVANAALLAGLDIGDDDELSIAGANSGHRACRYEGSSLILSIHSTRLIVLSKLFFRNCYFKLQLDRHLVFERGNSARIFRRMVRVLTHCRHNPTNRCNRCHQIISVENVYRLLREIEAMRPEYGWANSRDPVRTMHIEMRIAHQDLRQAWETGDIVVVMPPLLVKILRFAWP